ncbi:MAG: hypothetical protein A3K03_10440 [Bdellovibrionales bacterium RIFOXYD1_FULL_44_7]|nr:MAG: hypothetical protein A3K03_10440 [Bdellovibrionales bacterium RIFOXYD1_FULL_44_7]
MLKRPSSRRKTGQHGITLNLVPILDAMVTLIGFLLFTMAFTALVTIESPFPVASTKDLNQKIKEKPLQLTITVKQNQTEIWSPFDRINTRVIANAEQGQPDYRAIHEALISVKQQFPEESQIVVVPFPGASYDVLISLLDSIRLTEPSDPPVFRRNTETGNDELVKNLFSDVVFGNLLGDS